MIDEYKLPPKFIPKESIFSLLTPIPTLGSVLFSIFGYIFLWADDVNGARTFLVLALGCAIIAIVLSLIALVVPRKKKKLAFLMFLISATAAAVVFYIDPNILGNLDFWSAPQDVIRTAPPS